MQALNNKYNFYIITKTYRTEVVNDGKYNIRYISNFTHNTILKCNRRIEDTKFVWLNKLLLLLTNIYKLIITQFSYPTANSWEIEACFHELENISKEIQIDSIIPVSNTFLSVCCIKIQKETQQCQMDFFCFRPLL